MTIRLQYQDKDLLGFLSQLDIIPTKVSNKFLWITYKQEHVAFRFKEMRFICWKPADLKLSTLPYLKADVVYPHGTVMSNNLINTKYRLQREMQDSVWYIS